MSKLSSEIFSNIVYYLDNKILSLNTKLIEYRFDPPKKLIFYSLFRYIYFPFSHKNFQYLSPLFDIVPSPWKILSDSFDFCKLIVKSSQGNVEIYLSHVINIPEVNISNIIKEDLNLIKELDEANDYITKLTEGEQISAWFYFLDSINLIRYQNPFLSYNPVFENMIKLLDNNWSEPILIMNGSYIKDLLNSEFIFSSNILEVRQDYSISFRGSITLHLGQITNGVHIYENVETPYNTNDVYVNTYTTNYSDGKAMYQAKEVIQLIRINNMVEQFLQKRENKYDIKNGKLNGFNIQYNNNEYVNISFYSDDTYIWQLSETHFFYEPTKGDYFFINFNGVNNLTDVIYKFENQTIFEEQISKDDLRKNMNIITVDRKGIIFQLNIEDKLYIHPFDLNQNTIYPCVIVDYLTAQFVTSLYINPSIHSLSTNLYFGILNLSR